MLLQIAPFGHRVFTGSGWFVPATSHLQLSATRMLRVSPDTRGRFSPKRVRQTGIPYLAASTIAPPTATLPAITRCANRFEVGLGRHD